MIGVVGGFALTGWKRWCVNESYLYHQLHIWLTVLNEDRFLSKSSLAASFRDIMVVGLSHLYPIRRLPLIIIRAIRTLLLEIHGIINIAN